MPLDAATQRVLKATKFPPEFDKRVDTKKVNLDVIKTWIASKINDILPEDDIVVDMVYNILETDQFPKIKELQVQLQGFLDAEGPKFCKELWNLMLSAQESPLGVPTAMLEAKKLELQQEKVRRANPSTSITFTVLTCIHRHPKPRYRTAAKKSKCLIRSAATSVLIVDSIADPTVDPTVVVTALNEVAVVEASEVTVVHVVAMKGLLHRTLRILLIIDKILTTLGEEGALHHRVVSEMSTCQKVAAAVVAADVVIDLAIAADLLLLDDPGHPFVVAVVRHRRAAQGALLDGPAEHPPPIAPDLRFVAPVALLQGRLRVVRELGVMAGHFLQAMTAEGCAGLALDLLHQGTSQAHHHSGCRDLDLEVHRAVDEVMLNHDHPIHGLLPHNLRERRTDGDVPHLL
ncbi:hypothetical protein SLS60_005490 [Paraconiothyrium brasiliense]|uniref:PWI domain-containing protein n=1 Tax=Paraconiothyrium brasiliense TaxID=300254 RepID=A0ABR3RI68_9PLEO